MAMTLCRKFCFITLQSSSFLSVFNLFHVQPFFHLVKEILSLHDEATAQSPSINLFSLFSVDRQFLISQLDVVNSVFPPALPQTTAENPNLPPASHPARMDPLNENA